MSNRATYKCQRIFLDSNRFSRILILDSIPELEPQTAKNLLGDLQTVAKANSPSPLIEYKRVESGDDLLTSLRVCRDEVAAGGMNPMLHIECHGDEFGLELADGSALDWSQLKAPMTELNIATELNLMIAVAACTGGALAKMISMGDRAPFWGLIGPTCALYPHQLERAYRALYTTLLNTKSPMNAVAAMDAATKIPGSYWRTTAQGLFQKGCNNYKSLHCTEEMLDLRAARMLSGLATRRPPPYPPAAQLKQRLLDIEPAAFERYRTTFFMADLFVGHRERFDVAVAEPTL